MQTARKRSQFVSAGLIPSKYQICDYIYPEKYDSTKNQDNGPTINTGLYATGDFEVETEWLRMYDIEDWACVIVTYSHDYFSPTVDNYYCLGYTSSYDTMRFKQCRSSGDFSYSYGSYQRNVWYHAIMNKDGVTINGNKVVSSLPVSEVTYPHNEHTAVHINGMFRSDGSFIRQINMKLKETIFRSYSTKEEIAHFVPVIIKSTGKGGMYDTVRQQLFTSETVQYGLDFDWLGGYL